MASDTYLQRVLSHSPSPDFANLQAVLNKRLPSRPTLFEFFLNGRLYGLLSERRFEPKGDGLDGARQQMMAFWQAGYDYCTYRGSDFCFPAGARDRDHTISLNEGALITDWDSFETYEWMDPDTCCYDSLEKLADELPDGMRFIVNGPGGVLENVIRLTGYDNLCFMLVDNPDLARTIFDAVGSRLVAHYKNACEFESVGACISNDDWGFKTQPMLSPSDLRKYVFPWHRKIVETIHGTGRPAILHSCGNPAEIMDDVVDDMKFDGRHSYEDAIQPVEEAYKEYASRIAILGGIDVDFVIRSQPDDVYRRSDNMLQQASGHGSYALGTGNSVPEYVPDEHYAAMIWAALKGR